MGLLLKIVIICVVVYYSVRFVAGILLPIYMAAKKIQKQQQQFTSNKSSNHSPDSQNNQVSYRGGDYIEYEEIENR